MNRKGTLIVLAFILAVAAPTHQATAYYELIDLGTLGGGSSSDAYSINNHGQIVGRADDGYGNGRATFFDPTGGGNNIALGTSPSSAYSINDYGQIVGLAFNSSGYQRATLFDPTGGGNNIDLGTLGGNYSGAYSINNNGQIVGRAFNWQGTPKATLFDSTGGKRNIDLGLSGYYTAARSINDYGQIVGGYQDPFAWPGDKQGAFLLLDPTDFIRRKIIFLGTLYGWPYSYAYSINNYGQIVGRSFDEPYDFPKNGRATLFDPTGGGNNIDLGTLGGMNTIAYSINDNGQIVGTAYDSSGKYRATLFDPSGGGNNIDLNTLIDPSLGWTLQYAYSINDNGWIVGSGINPAGLYRAYLLIPEPASAMTLGLGGIFFALRRRRR